MASEGLAAAVPSSAPLGLSSPPSSQVGLSEEDAAMQTLGRRRLREWQAAMQFELCPLKSMQIDKVMAITLPMPLHVSEWILLGGGTEGEGSQL